MPSRKYKSFYMYCAVPLWLPFFFFVTLQGEKSIVKSVIWKFALSASSHIKCLTCKLMLNIFFLFPQMVELIPG